MPHAAEHDARHAAADRDLSRLLDLVAAGRVDQTPSGLQAAHDVAATLPEQTPLVLAISVGGSTTKLMLSQRHGGRFVAHALVVQPNPPADEPLPWRMFFNKLITGEPRINEALRRGVPIGFSVAVEIRDGVPFHKTKMPGLIGLIARDLDRDAATHRLADNVADWVRTEGFGHCPMAFAADGAVAHLGGTAAHPSTDAERTLLLVCGTGLACADRDAFMLTGMAPVLDTPDHLHTEGGQYQYLIAGKGVWDTMRRACQTALPDLDADAWWTGPATSELVGDLAADRPAPAALEAARPLAADVMARGTDALANCVIAALAMQQQRPAHPPPLPVKLYLEGSIARDAWVMPRLHARLAHLAGRRLPLGNGTLLVPSIRLCDRPPTVDTPALPPTLAQQIELTLVGAATLAMTHTSQTR